jgi:hypothetical protein
MKHVVLWSWLMLLCSSAVGLSQSFVVEFAYFDLASGPLSIEPGSRTPIADGSLCQIIEDFAHDGIAPAALNGTPGEGDRLLPLSSKDSPGHSMKSGIQFSSFPMNGQNVFGSAGYFYVWQGVSGTTASIAPIYLRIWNHADPKQATAYWDTPLYRILPGRQQMAFSKAQMTYHRFEHDESRNSGDGTSSSNSTFQNAMIRDFALHDAYPNPFNPTTTISFDLPEASMVDVRVFDIMGREVRHLLNEMHSAGQVQVMFDGSNLPSGLYLVSAKLGDKYMSTKKITLLK